MIYELRVFGECAEKLDIIITLYCSNNINIL